MSAIFRVVESFDKDVSGLRCKRPTPFEVGEFEPTYEDFPKLHWHCVSGERMIAGARKRKIDTGLRHAEAMLREQDKIPENFKDFKLLFTEVWENTLADRFLWCLMWQGSYWKIYLCDLNIRYDASYKIVTLHRK